MINPGHVECQTGVRGDPARDHAGMSEMMRALGLPVADAGSMNEDHPSRVGGGEESLADMTSDIRMFVR